MQREEVLKRAFNCCQRTLRRAVARQVAASRVNPTVVVNAITLAWVLGILPDHLDECATQRMLNDSGVVPVDVGLLRFLVEVEVPVDE